MQAATGQDELVKIFSMKIRKILSKLGLDYGQLQEIRLRAGAPLLILYANKEYFVTEDGKRSQNREEAYCVRKEEITETLEFIADYSLYAFEDEVKQGFITIPGGHRVGIAGKTVLDKNEVKSLKYISCMNVRLSHQVKGCADPILPYIIEKGNICHTLIISPPRCGKTTLLRDMIRQVSDGKGNQPGKTVGVIDERSEIAGSYLGIPQNDLGIRTDVLDCCPKAVGMLMLLRSMSPDVLAVDEIGDYEDVHAIEYVIHCGCRLIATIHGNSMEDINRKPLLQKLVKEKVFDRYILLKNGVHAGVIEGIYDSRGSCLFREEENGYERLEKCE